MSSLNYPISLFITELQYKLLHALDQGCEISELYQTFLVNLV